jgi:hypothetical protein
MRTLEDIGNDAVYLLADDMDDDEFERVSSMSADEKVKYFYLSSDCDRFADALHRITGWPIVGVSSPSLGPIHRLVQAPNGRMLDAGGWVDEKGLKARYGQKELDISAASASIGSTSFGLDEDGIDHELVDAVAAVRQLPWEPFVSTEFREMSMRPVPGADEQPRSPLP